MKYALLVYSDQSGWEDIDEEEAARRREESMPAWIALFEELGKADPAAEGFELVGLVRNSSSAPALGCVAPKAGVRSCGWL